MGGAGLGYFLIPSQGLKMAAVELEGPHVHRWKRLDGLGVAFMLGESFDDGPDRNVGERLP